jgi:hypothetical protein
MPIVPVNPCLSQSAIALQARVTARATLDELSWALDTAREDLRAASGRWIAAQGWPEGWRGRGSLSHQDRLVTGR